MLSRLIYILVFFVASSFQPQRPVVTRWVIATGCSLKVDGSTNVNKFTCAISNYSKPDTILVTQSTRPVVQLTGSMQLDVNRFDCFNPMMTADLRKTLKAKEFPHLTIKFISINHYPLSTEANTVTQGIVVIELAGISRTYSVNYRIISASRNFVNLVGFQQLKFSDFKITPPRKIGGMIKTNNDLTVVFDLKMKVIP